MEIQLNYLKVLTGKKRIDSVSCKKTYVENDHVTQYARNAVITLIDLNYLRLASVTRHMMAYMPAMNKE